jgi:phosphatidylserine decarboxylase
MFVITSEIILLFLVTLLNLHNSYLIYTLLPLLFLFYFNRYIHSDKPDKKYIFSPAFGYIGDIKQEKSNTRVSIILGLHDIHVQYAPIESRLLSQKYHKGKFIPVFSVEKTNDNEKLTCSYKSYNNIHFQVEQIAGTIARTIINFNNIGSYIKQGQLLGMIKLGSRVDLIFPTHNMDLLKKTGDKIEGGKPLALFIE